MRAGDELPGIPKAPNLEGRGSAWSLPEASLQVLELLPQDARQAVPEHRVVLLDGADLRPPFPGIDREHGGEVVPVHVEALEVERLRGRDGADRGFGSTRPPGDPLADPGEHPAVLAVAGPEEAALGALAEPVHEEDLRELGGVGCVADLQPVPEV